MFANGTDTYQAPPLDGSSTEVVISPTSDSLQLLKPFEAWHKGNAEDLTVLVKVRGQSATSIDTR